MCVEEQSDGFVDFFDLGPHRNSDEIFVPVEVLFENPRNEKGFW